MKTSCSVIDSNFGSEKDKLDTRNLELLLRSKNLYESQEDALKREEVLGKLNEIVKE